VPEWTRNDQVADVLWHGHELRDLTTGL
jgi:hypothetical protein